MSIEKFNSINPKKLITQEGPNRGQIAAIEFGRGNSPSVEGLPVIGAYAEKKFRETNQLFLDDNNDSSAFFKNGMADLAGENAMAEEVERRAKEEIRTQPKELREKIAEQALDSFNNEVNHFITINKYTERQSIDTVQKPAPKPPTQEEAEEFLQYLKITDRKPFPNN